MQRYGRETRLVKALKRAASVNLTPAVVISCTQRLLRLQEQEIQQAALLFR